MDAEDGACLLLCFGEQVVFQLRPSPAKGKGRALQAASEQWNPAWEGCRAAGWDPGWDPGWGKGTVLLGGVTEPSWAEDCSCTGWTLGRPEGEAGQGRVTERSMSSLLETGRRGGVGPHEPWMTQVHLMPEALLCASMAHP